MTDYQHILNLLQQKKDILLNLEKITEPMGLFSVDELSNCIEQRTSLLSQMGLIDKDVKRFCENDDLLRQTLNHTCIRGDLSEELTLLYDVSLNIKAIIMRLKNNDENIKQHLEFEKSRILDRIENLNKSGPVVAKQYNKSMQTALKKPASFKKSTII